MSALAKKCRGEMEAKARRLAGETVGKVDSSNWSPAKPLNTEKKTGLQPLGERMARKSGGRVEGEKAVVDAYVNRDVKAANAKAEGKPHEGGYKKGGKVAKLTEKMKGMAKKDGGKVDGSSGRGSSRKLLSPSSWGASGQGSTGGGRGGIMDTGSEGSSGKSGEIWSLEKGARGGGSSDYTREGQIAEGHKKGGRVARASGGRAKGKTDIRINILAGQKPPMDGVAPAPAMMPAPGLNPMPAPAPAPAPAAPPPALPIPNSPMPMGRKAGGRVYRSYKDMDAGACSGDGRLEKTEIQEKKRRA